MAPRAMRAEKIMSSKVSPSPRPYQGPSSVMRRIISSADVSGGGVNRQEQLSQNSSICMGLLHDGTCFRKRFCQKQGQYQKPWIELSTKKMGPNSRKKLVLRN